MISPGIAINKKCSFSKKKSFKTVPDIALLRTKSQNLLKEINF